MNKRIVCLGDSLTYGYPYGPEYSWVYYVSSKISLDLINAGVNGNTMEDMNLRYQRDVCEYDPDALIISGGTNDAYDSEISCSATVYHLEQIIKKTLTDDISPIVALPIYPLDEHSVDKMEQIRLYQKELAIRYAIPCLDFAVAFFESKKVIKADLYLDGVHPNTVGYKSMGELALKFLQDFFQR